MSANPELLYGLEDRPNLLKTSTAAFQHVLASFVGVITPTLIIAAALGLESHIPFLVSMALFVSGMGTVIQTKRIGRIGSGLVAVQGTSFAFVSALILAGTTVRSRGGSDDEVMAMLMGISIAGALVEVGLSFFIHRLKRLLNPVITGIVITSIGLSLIKVGMTDLAGGFGATDFGQINHVGLGLSVLFIIIFLNASSNLWLRLSAIFIGMALGTLCAWSFGNVSFAHLSDLPVLAFPAPFQYGIAFDFSLFLPVALIYLFSALETAGDLTANSVFCNQPIKGPLYIKRIQGGILGDGINSVLAACFNTFPNTTFGQNNGVIQLTGIASRRVGIAIGIFYLLSGIFPVIGGILQAIPKAVLGGATLVMFAMVAVGGLKILMQQTLDRRTSLITASALGMGMGVMMVPAMTNGFPDWLANIVASPVTMAGITAVFLDVILPETGKPLPKKHVFDNSPKEQKKLDPDLVQNTRLSHHEGAN